MSQNNHEKQKLLENYEQQKMTFLDDLQPDDFRNGGSFNQAEIIFDEINKAVGRMIDNNKNPEEFIKKAMAHLFREDSAAQARAVELAKVYVDLLG